MLLFASSIGFSQVQSFNITADKIQKPQEQTSGKTQIIDSKDIEDSGVNNLPDLLNSLAGFHVFSSGAYGGTSPLRTRGLPSGFTKIIVDGITQSDPSDINNNYELQFVDIDNIESIEVSKGAQSSLYGSSALGGVINIKTKPGKKAVLSYGQDNTLKSSLKYHSHGLSFYGSHFETEGLSHFPGEGAERDSLYQRNLHGSYKKEFKDYSSEFKIKNIHSKKELDDFQADLRDNDLYQFDQNSLALKFSGNPNQGLWDFNITLTRNDIKRSYDALSTLYRGKENSIKIQNTFLLSPHYSLLIGIDYEKMESLLGNVETNAFYITQFFNFEKIFFNTNARVDDHQLFGKFGSYQAGFGFKLGKKHTIKINKHHGFNAPTLFQLKSPLYGDQSLNPSISNGHEIVYEKIKKQLSYSVTLFDQTIKNRIEFITKYANQGSSRHRGFELSTKANLNEKINYRMNYSYTDANHSSNNNQIARTPYHSWNNFISYQFHQKIKSQLAFNYISSRIDNDFNKDYMPSYTLVHLNFDYKINEKLKTSIYFHNIFDKKYEQIKSYATRGLSIYAKIIWNI